MHIRGTAPGLEYTCNISTSELRYKNDMRHVTSKFLIKLQDNMQMDNK